MPIYVPQAPLRDIESITWVCGAHAKSIIHVPKPFTLGCLTVLPVRGRDTEASYGAALAGNATGPRSSHARAFGPGNLGPDFGPLALGLRPQTGPKPASDARPGDRKHIQQEAVLV